MNILFITMSNIVDLNDHDIYQDLAKTFVENNHKVYVVSPSENQRTELINSSGGFILRVKVGAIYSSNLLKKGMATLRIKHHYLKAINQFLRDVKFDLILYATPPITIAPLIKKLKRKHRCVTYLMLKDIFPQNAVDLGMMSTKGLKGFIYKHFKRQEKKLYENADYIGCMSPKNLEYLQYHNRLNIEKLEICPNALLPQMYTRDVNEISAIKNKFGIPQNKIVLGYGGNLGRPQGIGFLVECLSAARDIEDFFFVIVGDGTEFGKIQKYIDENNPQNVLLLKKLKREEYFSLASSFDVGMIFLDYKFTIPNFPSRILPYMEKSIPIACVTDKATDVGDIVEKNRLGWKCFSNDSKQFLDMLKVIKKSDLLTSGKNARDFLENQYNSTRCYTLIVSKIEK